MTNATDKTRLSTQEMWESGYAGSDAGGVAPYASPQTRAGTYEVVRVLRRHLPNPQGLQLLEMGCGGSKYLPWMAREMGLAPNGIDYTESGCKSARRALESINATGSIFCVDFMELDPSFHGKYDVVTSFGVVEHFINTGQVLACFADTLAPGGKMITFVPNVRSLAGSLVKRLDRALFDTHKLFDLAEFAGYHQEAGLQVLEATYTEWLDFEWLPMHRMNPTVGFVAKNVFHYLNRMKLSAYKRMPSFHPQSSALCSGMIVVARKPP